MSLRTRRISKLYISESDLKARILTGQIEILDDVLNECRVRNEQAIFSSQDYVSAQFKNLIVQYSKYRTELAREKSKLETEK